MFPLNHAIMRPTDVSVIGSGGVIRRPSDLAEVFQTAVVQFHANVQETFVVYEVLRLLVNSHPDLLRASTISMDVNNKHVLHAVQNKPMYNLF